MNLLEAILLGVVEGITEFLPISSTGHLILTTKLLGIPPTEFVTSFEIAIQLGAIMAVVVLYGWALITNISLLKRVVAAFVPTAILGLTLYSFIKEELLGNVAVVVWSLIIGGFIIIIFEHYHKPKIMGYQDETITYRQAIMIGLIQSISFIPGVSRAAATIMGGLFVGLSRWSAARFSFLLAIPTMSAAVAFDLLKTGANFTSNEYTLLGVGFITAFVMAMISIRYLMRYLEHHNFSLFGIYRIIVGLIFLLFIF
ncbi:MAG: undecaprenyl-diphosphatase UppP [Anaplasmataceae bacterium]|nr:undecaprenyl-diphosphatase UppP [Anaplasmataceae bacterium]